MSIETHREPMTRFSEDYIESHQLPYDLESAVGQLIDIKPVSWNTRDLLLYAVGIGAGKDDLRLVYENHPQFSAFPTYPGVLDLKESRTDIAPFVNPVPPIAGLPTFDPKSLLHVGHSMQFVKKLPLTSGNGWTQTKRISGIHEKPNGVTIDIEAIVSDPSGDPYTITQCKLFYVKAVANGVPFSQTMGGLLPQVGKIEKGRNPDFVEEFETSPTQAIMYRLSGDYNPHCIDPVLGVKAGLKGATLHGLATWGICARLLVKAVAGGESSALKAYSCKFSSPVQPGDKLQVNIWDTGVIVADGSKEFAFQATNLTTGKKAVSGGVAHLDLAQKSKL